MTPLETLLIQAEEGALAHQIRLDFSPDYVEGAIANLKLLIAHAYKCGQLAAVKEINEGYNRKNDLAAPNGSIPDSQR